MNDRLARLPNLISFLPSWIVKLKAFNSIYFKFILVSYLE